MQPQRRSRLPSRRSALPVAVSLFVLAAAVLLVSGRAVALTPLPGTQGWTEVAASGFDDKNNAYAVDVIEFQGQ